MGGSEGGLAVVTMQHLPHTNGSGKMERATCMSTRGTDSFPVGMRVLVVDDDPTCLVLLEKLLHRCQYQVTTCGQAITALKMLREDKDKFDLVLSDVCMPDMDGFKLLELVGLEMDLPVIMMSGNGETSAVMKGITHGACDYLLKPVRIEELKNIWQHVVRKKRNGTKDHDHPWLGDETDRTKHEIENGEHGSSANDGAEGGWKLNKKRKDQKDDDDNENEHENDDPSGLKRPRVVWSVELHQQFVSAVNQLGIDKAVPKRIMELMNVQGLTRENVASHLQKYRLYLKRLSGVANQQGGMAGAFGGGREFSFASLASMDGLGNLQALAASGQLPTHAIASLQSGRLNSTSVLGIPGLNSSGLHQLPALQNSNSNSLGRAHLAPHSVNTSGNLLSCLPGGHEIENIQQKQQIPSLGGVAAPMDKPAQLPRMQHRLTAENGLVSFGGGSGNFRVNPMNNTLMLKYMQQQQQKQCRGLVDLPPTGIVGQQHGPNDISGPSAKLSNTIGINGNWANGILPSVIMPNARPLGDLSTSTNLPLQHRPETLLRVSDVDCKPVDILTAGNGSLTPIMSLGRSSPSVTTLAGPSQNLTTGKCSSPTNGNAINIDMGNMNECVASDNCGFKFPLIEGLNIGLRQGLQQNIKQDWLNQTDDFGHIANSVLSPPFSKVSSVNQKFMETYGGQTQMHNPGYSLQKTNSAVRQTMDHVVPWLGGKCDSEQSTADSQLQLKEDHQPESVKMERGFLSENGDSADDLMSIILKQQHETVGFADDDMGCYEYPLETCM